MTTKLQELIIKEFFSFVYMINQVVWSESGVYQETLCNENPLDVVGLPACMVVRSFKTEKHPNVGKN